jgi:GntR family transcriptional regulator
VVGRVVAGIVPAVSRYERIAAALRDGILAGQYAPGDRLPRQRDLARAWKTTLPTVRQALEQLQRDGLLRVEHGVGTFVADLDRAYDPFAVASFTEALRERGLEVETRLVSVDTRAHSMDAAAALGTTDREHLVGLTRVRLVGNVPIVYQRSYTAGRHRSKLARYDGTIPLYAFLRDRTGLLAASYRETISAEPTPDVVAQVLGVPAGAPILVARRTTATVHGEPFLYDEAHLPPDRMRVTITRQGARCAVELSPILVALEAAL